VKGLDRGSAGPGMRLQKVGYLIAQEWSAAQKEIWKVEEETMAALEKGDVEKLMSYIHADYRGCSLSNKLISGSLLPTTGMN